MWIRCAVFMLLIAFEVRAQPPSSPPASLTELQARLESIVTHDRFRRAAWGVKIVSLTTGKTWFEHDAEKLLSPASNTKLFTVALALDRFGPEYRIGTSFFALRQPSADGTLEGDLIVYGRGDPLPTSRPGRTNLSEVLLPFVQALTNAGVKRVTGDLVADASFFQGPGLGAGWVWDDPQYYYGAEISSLTLHDNLVVLQVQADPMPGLPCRIEVQPEFDLLVISNRTLTAEAGAESALTFFREPGRNLLYIDGTMPAGAEFLTNEVPVHKPALLFGHSLRAALDRGGVGVAGQVRAIDWLDRRAAPLGLSALQEITRVESVPLRDIVREIQKPSHNLFTDLLFAHTGEMSRTVADEDTTSEELAVRELSRFLCRSAIDPRGVYIEEGSGLSRNNLVSASAIVDLLISMAKHPAAQTFIEALPVAGVDGTLRRRFAGTPVEGKLWAKTGSLRWATSLSGYLDTVGGERLVFSLLLNRYRPEAEEPSARDALDAVVATLAAFTGTGTE